MRPRFQADANFSGLVISGLLAKDPRIDFRTSHSLKLTGLPDEKVLLKAANDDRILVSHDLRTMPTHFGRFIITHDSPGVLIVPRSMSVAAAIESLLMVWVASDHDEYFNRIVMLPF